MLEYKWRTVAHTCAHTHSFLLPSSWVTCEHKQVCLHPLFWQGGQRPRSGVTNCSQQWPAEDLNYSWVVGHSLFFTELLPVGYYQSTQAIQNLRVAYFAPVVLWQPPDGPARSIQQKPQTPWGSRGSFAVSQQNFLMSTGPWHWECLTDTCQNIRWMQISKARLSLVSWCVCYHSGALYSPSIQGLTDPWSSY